MTKIKYHMDTLVPYTGPRTPSGHTVCFYHGYCQDGFFAALFIKKAMKQLGIETTCIAVDYADRHTFVEAWADRLYGKVVFIADFSVTPKDFRRLVDITEATIQLDHHVSVLREWGFSEDIQQRNVVRVSYPNLDTPLTADQTMLPYVPEQREDVPITAKPRIGQFFYDVEESGAALAMAYYHYVLGKCNTTDVVVDLPGRTLVKYLRDRDLWLKEFAQTDWINSYISNQPWFILGDFDGAWEFLIKFEQSEEFRNEVAVDGERAAKLVEAECLRAITSTMHLTRLPNVDYTIPTVVCPKHLTSRVGEIIYDAGFAAALMVNVVKPGKYLTLSFRSPKEGGAPVDVIATDLLELGFEYDGCVAVSAGGHRNAAGVVMKKK